MEWANLRGTLRFGQIFQGVVVSVPYPGRVGIFVDIGLSVQGFVDLSLLPANGVGWPTEGTVSDFEIWWADSRQQIRLKPVEPRYLRENFTEFTDRFRPSWPSDIGRPIPDPEDDLG